MSATHLPAIDLQEQISRIDRMIAETQKFQEESFKLRDKAAKLRAQGLKLNRDRWLAPILVITGMITGIAGVLVAVVTLMLRGGR